MGYLETDIVKLRAPEPSDVELIYLWENDVEIWKVSNTLTPFSKYALAKYIENYKLDIFQTKQLRLIIEAKESETGQERPVGLIDLFDYDPFHQRAGVGILVHNAEDRKKGYASEALKALSRYAFEYLRLHQLYCNISEGNEASLALFESQGFKILGLKEGWTKTAKGWIGEYFLQKINPLAYPSQI